MKIVVDEKPKSIYDCLFIGFDFKATHAAICKINGSQLCKGVELCPFLKEEGEVDT